jgi:diaminohydroxyphosphoribosylaminopyrimidine deaminase/5-amino-6-(5-phosphoribosylamino)uracil reductase
LLACESAGNPQEDTSNLDLSFLLAHLGRCGVQQVLVEGGPRVAASFLRTGQADEVCVYIAPKILGAVGTAGLDEPMASLGSLLALRQVEIKTFGEDVRLSGRLPRETAAP